MKSNRSEADYRIEEKMKGEPRIAYGPSNGVGAGPVRRGSSIAGVRPGRGTGTSGADLFQWQRPSEARSVADDRKGKLLCGKCKAEVAHLETSPGVWSTRDRETGFVHEMTCEG